MAPVIGDILTELVMEESSNSSPDTFMNRFERRKFSIQNFIKN
jgi:hypothetical protein